MAHYNIIYIYIGPPPPIYLPVRYNSITHTHALYPYILAGSRTRFSLLFSCPVFSAPLLSLYYTIIIIIIIVSCPCGGGDGVDRSRLPRSVLFSNYRVTFGRMLQRTMGRYNAQKNRLWRPTAPLENIRAHVWFTSDDHGPSLIVFIYHTVQRSRCPHVYVYMRVLYTVLYTCIIPAIPRPVPWKCPRACVPHAVIWLYTVSVSYRVSHCTARVTLYHCRAARDR